MKLKKYHIYIFYITSRNSFTTLAISIFELNLDNVFSKNYYMK